MESQKVLIQLARKEYYAVNYNLAVEYCSMCIGENCALPGAYLYLAKMCTSLAVYGNNINLNPVLLQDSFILSLYLNGSLYENGQEISGIYAELGRIYKNGLLGEPIDISKAKYYLKLGVKQTRLYKDYLHITNNGSVFALLGILYVNEVKKFNKSKPIWKEGALLKDSVCYNQLIIWFTDDKHNINNLKFLNDPTNHFVKSSYYASIADNFKEYDQEQSNHQLDLNQVKIIAMDKTTKYPFIFSMYSTHLNIIKFINQFNQLIAETMKN